MAAPPNARVLLAEVMPLHEQARLRQIFAGIEGASTGLSVEDQVKFLARSTRQPPPISRKRPAAAAAAAAAAGAKAAAAVTDGTTSAAVRPTTEGDGGVSGGAVDAMLASAEAAGVTVSKSTAAAPVVGAKR